MKQSGQSEQEWNFFGIMMIVYVIAGIIFYTKDRFLKKRDYSFSARLNSFRFAFSGVYSFFRNEPNAAIHLVAAIFAVSLGFILDIDSVKWVILTILIGFVFVTEIINSAIEKISDIIHPAISPDIKKIKDYAAAAVLISALTALIGGLLIFLPEI